MKSWKKVSIALLSLTMTTAMAMGFVACGGGEENNSSIADSSSEVVEDSSSEVVEDSSSEVVEDSSSEIVEDSSSEVVEDSSSETDVPPIVVEKEEYVDANGDTYPALTVVENYQMFSWTEYEKVQDATCCTAGIKQQTCVDDQTIIHQEYITPRGHTYENGICACGVGPIFPEDDAEINWIRPQDGDVPGRGQAFDRYEMTTGYFEVTASTRGEIWLSFSIPESGQYALYTIGDVNNNVEIKRYDASSQYIPVGENEQYLYYASSKLEDGTIYSSFNCNDQYWSNEWRATYSIKGSGDVKFRLVRIDESPWSPISVLTPYLATQINNKTASEGADGTQPTVVPYDSEYFYEESSGYYRMGTPENPGPIIYVAITKIAERMLQDKSFTQIQYELASNLHLQIGYTVDGDYLLRDYIPMISNDTSYGGKPGNCYQDFVNSDGLYPVNQELFEFLNYFTQKNKPMTLPDEYQWPSEEYSKVAWLAPCYYYKSLTPGTEDFPILLEEIGEVQVQSGDFEYTYYELLYTNNNSSSTITYCTISCDNENIWFDFNGTLIEGAFSIVVETGGSGVVNGITFAVGSANFIVENFTLTITPSYEGSQDDPVIINSQEGDQVVALETIAHNLINGEVTHQKYYTFVAAENGTLSIKLDQDINVFISLNSTIYTVNEFKNVELVAGDKVEIVVGPTTNAVSANATFTWTAA